MLTFRYTTHLPFPRAEVFEWFSRPGALVRLTPSFFGSVISPPSKGTRKGSTAVLGVAAPGSLGMWLGTVTGSVAPMLPRKLRIKPEVRWDALHAEYSQDEFFTDVMVKGPLKSWHHQHTFVDGAEPGTTVMTDSVRYELPAFASFGLTQKIMDNELKRMFAFRERQLLADLELHAKYPKTPQIIVIAGGSGLVGTQLKAMLEGGGHTVRSLVRRTPKVPGEYFWDPSAGLLDSDVLADADAVVNLAGHTIGGRFTDATKQLILSSRLETTSLLARKLGQLASDGKQRTFVCASGSGYYGANQQSRGTAVGPDHFFVEGDPAGTDFLADVCVQWEDACAPARDAGVRVVNIRTGLVMSAGGGILQRLLPLYLSGVGGPVGKDEWQSWVGIDDITGTYLHALLDTEVNGPINAVAKKPVRAQEFAHILGKVLHRPAIVAVPDVGPELLLGKEGAQELALASARLSNKSLESSGYAARHDGLEAALRHILGR